LDAELRDGKNTISLRVRVKWGPERRKGSKCSTAVLIVTKEMCIYMYLVGLGFELSLESRHLYLEPHLQSILLLLFWRWGLETICSDWP
jgi:hypothetical protein